MIFVFTIALHCIALALYIDHLAGGRTPAKGWIGRFGPLLLQNVTFVYVRRLWKKFGACSRCFYPLNWPLSRGEGCFPRIEGPFPKLRAPANISLPHMGGSHPVPCTLSASFQERDGAQQCTCKSCITSQIRQIYLDIWMSGVKSWRVNIWSFDVG